MKKDIRFNTEPKRRIRNIILNIAKKGKRMLDFYGNGESYKLAKKRNINILSIDDGRDFKNYKTLKEEMIGPDKKIISLRKLAIEGFNMKPKFDTLWLDFCGLLNREFLKDTIPYLPNIMAKKGYLFITLLHARESYGKKLTRKEIDRITKQKIRQAFVKENIKLLKFIEFPYTSHPTYKDRKKTSGTPMIVYGFKWKTKKTII